MKKGMTTKYTYTRSAGSQSEVLGIAFIGDGALSVTGYQDFVISRAGFRSLARRQRKKYAMVRPYLARPPADTALVDIGCSAGAIGLQAYFDGFRHVTFLDHDQEYLEVVRQCLALLDAETCSVRESSVKGYGGRAEVGFAFALIHWIYSYSEQAGSLDEAIRMLKRIAPEGLFIEWVAPTDSAIMRADHINKNPDVRTGPYTLVAFREALLAHYGHIVPIGATSATRSIWYASTVSVKRSLATRIKTRLQILMKEWSGKPLMMIRKLLNRW